MNSRTAGTTGIAMGLLWLAVIAAAAVGWIWNIVKLIGSFNDPLTAFTVARGFGVFFPPLGVVLGYL